MRITETDDDALLADAYYRHWLAMGFAPADVAPDWREAALRFLADARRDRAFAGFVARDDGRAGGDPISRAPAVGAVNGGTVSGGVVGSACCHVVERAYPAFWVADALRVGYVWGVFVEPPRRGRGIGAALVRACVAHLAAQGCGRVLLHAGERSRPLYARLGFVPTDELALDLPPVA